MGERFNKFKKRRDCSFKSLKEVECFLRSVSVVKKGKKAFNIFAK